MSNLTILNTAIRQFDNLFSLNDLHRVGGGESKHKPTNFIRLDTTQELVAEIQKEDPAVIALQSNNGGVNRGTYACMEIALAYAMWIDPKFHLIVLRAYMAMKNDELQNQQQNLPLAQPEPTYSRTLTERQWLKFASLWFACYNNLELLGRIYPPLEALGSRLGVEAYTHCTEYRTTLEVMKRILKPILAEFDVDPRKEPHYYRALRTLREFELKGLGAVVKI